MLKNLLKPSIFLILFSLNTLIADDELVITRGPNHKVNDSNNLANISSSNINQNKPNTVILNRQTTSTKGTSNIPQIAATVDFPEDITTMRQHTDLITRRLNQPLYGSSTAVTKNVNYVANKTVPLVLKKDFSTIIEFKDSSNSEVKFEYISPGSPDFQITQFHNKIEIKAKASYKQSNLTVGIKGYDDPIMFYITEDSQFENYHSFVRVNMANKYNFKSSSTNNIEVKSQILNEVFKFNELKRSDSIDYEVYGLHNKDYVLFNESLLKIYRINKFNKDYYIVLLDKNFELYGFNKQSFSQYDDKYSVYFLNYNDSVFTIRTARSVEVNDSYLEKYRIVIKG